MNIRTVIVGMGPAGLMSALYHLKLGHAVTLIEGREKPFERDRQIVLSKKLLRRILRDFVDPPLNNATLKYHINYKSHYDIQLQPAIDDNDQTTDAKFFRSIIQNHGAISISAVQTYLHDKLTQEKTELLEIKTSSAVTLDKSMRKLIYRDSAGLTEIQFDNLILAEGSKRVLTSLLINTESKSLPVPRADANNYIAAKVKLLNITPEIQQTLSSRPLIAPVYLETSKIKTADLARLQAAGWDQDYLPITYIQYLPEQQSFYITSECPNTWSAENQQLILNLLQTTLQLEYPAIITSEIRLSAPATTFKVNPTYLEKASYDLGSNRHAFVIGDALLSANFMFGHGLENAINSAYAVFNCFYRSNGTFNNIKPVTDNLEDLKFDYFRKNKLYNLALHLRRNPIQRNMFTHAMDLKSNLSRTMSWLTTKPESSKNILKKTNRLT